ncbi:MAG: PAS domain S-box protein [Gemmatimonadetes bacterium]|nr:MAG: PAS domain S-box protein [Gemmatimonadota bacterium]
MPQTVQELHALLVQAKPAEKVHLYNELSIAVYHKNMSEMKRYVEEAIRWATTLNDQRGLARSYLIKGVYYEGMGKYDNALHYHYRSLEQYQKLGDKQYIARCYNNIGLVYASIQDYKTSLHYHQQALELNEELEAHPDIVTSYVNLGRTYFYLNNTEMAIQSYHAALAHYQPTENPYTTAVISMNLAEIYTHKNEFKSALTYQHHAETLFKNGNYLKEYAAICGNIGTSYSELNQNKKAIYYFNKSISISRQNGYKDNLLVVLRQLSEHYEKNGDFKAALATYKEYHDLHTTLFTEEKMHYIAQTQLQFEIAQTQKEAELEHQHNIKLQNEINERKKIEAELRKLHRAVEQSPYAITITDLEGNIEFINPAFTRITGYSQSEVLGKNPRILKSGKTEPAVYQEMWSTICSGNIWEGEILNKRKDNTLYWERLKINPVIDPHTNHITRFLAIQEDITARKEVEETLYRLNQELEERIKEKTELMSIVSHDLKNPLTGIIGYADLLLGTNVTPEEAKKTIHIIHDSSLRIMEMIVQLLDITRIEEGHLDLLSKEIDILYPLFQVVENYRQRASHLILISLNRRFQFMLMKMRWNVFWIILSLTRLNIHRMIPPSPYGFPKQKRESS